MELELAFAKAVELYAGRALGIFPTPAAITYAPASITVASAVSIIAVHILPALPISLTTKWSVLIWL